MSDFISLNGFMVKDKVARENIANESTARMVADSNLSKAIEEAIENLNTAISNEATSRENADNALRETIEANLNERLEGIEKAKFATGKSIAPFGEYAIEGRDSCYTQGMCIGDGKLYSFGSDDSAVSICNVTNLTTGATSTYALSLVGHYNDATFYNGCVVAVANETTVLFLNKDTLSEIKRVTVPYNVHQIAYEETTNKLYFANASFMFVYNVDGNDITYEKTIEISQPYTTQGMCAHDGFIFFSSYISPNVYGGTEADNNGGLINVYNLNGEIVHTYILEMSYGELEGIDIYNGLIILSYQRIGSYTGAIWTFYKTPIYSNTNVFNEEMFVENIKPFTLTLYVNRSYQGFFTEGTSEKPFVDLSRAVNFALQIGARDTTFNITGSHGDVAFNAEHGLMIFNGGTIKSINALRKSGILRFIGCTIGYEGIGKAGILSFTEIVIRGCTVYGATNAVEVQGAICTLNVSPSTFKATRGIQVSTGGELYISIAGNTFDCTNAFYANRGTVYSEQSGLSYVTSGVSKIIFMGERIDFGTANITCNAGESKEFTVNFTAPFTFNPTLQLSLRNTVGGMMNYCLYVKSSSATGFTGVICNNGETAITNQSVYWTAFAR